MFPCRGVLGGIAGVCRNSLWGKAIATVDRGAPTAIDVVFDVPLEDPALHLMTWRDGRLARLSPPPVGASVDLPWSPGPFRFF